MVDFGGWEMPIQYPSGIVAEHLYTRHACSLFDVSHMGRLLVEGPDRAGLFAACAHQQRGRPGPEHGAVLHHPHHRTGRRRGRRLSVPLRGRAVSCWWSTPPIRTRTWPTCEGRSAGLRLHPHRHHQPTMLSIAVQGPKSKELLHDSLRRRGNYGAGEKRPEHPDLWRASSRAGSQDRLHRRASGLRGVH